MEGARFKPSFAILERKEDSSKECLRNLLLNVYQNNDSEDVENLNLLI